jgi:hypothetical protein
LIIEAPRSEATHSGHAVLALYYTDKIQIALSLPKFASGRNTTGVDRCTYTKRASRPGAKMGWADHFTRLPRLFSKTLVPKQVKAVCFDKDL